MTQLAEVTGIELEELPQPVKCPHCGYVIAERVEMTFKNGDKAVGVRPLFLYGSPDLRKWYCYWCDKPYYNEPRKAKKRGGKLTVDS